MEKKLEIRIGNVQEVGKYLARETAEAIKRKFSKDTYVLACSKGNSVKYYYDAFREAFSSLKPDERAYVQAFAIDEDWATTKGLEDLKANMPEHVQVYGINARFIHEGRLVDNETLTKILEENPGEYRREGRAIKPLTSTGIFGEIIRARDDYEVDDEGLTRLYGRIGCALIGLGITPSLPIHIGSNFPPSSPEEITHLGEKVDNNGKVVGYAMTMGLRTLCSSRKVILFAAGKSKAEGIKRAIEGPVNENCPPSYLRKVNDLVLALDEDSASLLDKDVITEIYRDREIIWS